MLQIYMYALRVAQIHIYVLAHSCDADQGPLSHPSTHTSSVLCSFYFDLLLTPGCSFVAIIVLIFRCCRETLFEIPVLVTFPTNRYICAR